MRDRKLYDLLRRLSAEERALFVEFLRSPLHAHRPKLADMVQLMESMLFATPDRDCSSEEFYAAFYPGKPFDGNNLNRLISVITTEFKEFLALRFFQRDRTARTACATREMSRRRWDDILPKEIALTRKVLQEELPDDEHNYYQLYCLEYENARHQAEHTGTKGKLLFQPLLDASDLLFVHVKRKISIYSFMHDRKFNSEHLIRWPEILKDPICDALESQSLASQLFRSASELIIHNSTKETLVSYIDLLEAKLPHFNEVNQPMGLGKVNKVDAESLLGIAQNAIIDISRRDQGFQHTQNLRVVKEGITKGVFLEEGFLNAKFYENYTKTLALSGEFADAWEFQSNNIKILKEKDAQISPLLAAGLLEVFEKQPQKAIRTLTKLKANLNQTTPAATALEARILSCLSWYQLGEIESLIHEANALRAYLSRLKSISKFTLLTYYRFLTAITAVEKAERKPIDSRLQRYSKIVWDLNNKPKFTGSGILLRDINSRYGNQIKSWRQKGPDASF